MTHAAAAAKLIIVIVLWALAARFTVAQNLPIAQPPPAITFPARASLGEDDVSRMVGVDFPSAMTTSYPENNTVHVRAYFPASEVGPVPVVILLHYWGATDQRLEERFAARLNRRRIGAVLVELPYHLNRTPRGTTSGQLAIQPDPEKLIDCMVQSVWDVRRTIDWLVQQPDVRADKIGIAGTSLGSLVSEAVTGVDTRISTSCFILGGADIANILWESSRVVSQRETMRRNGYTEAKLRELLAPIEPLNLLSQRTPPASMVVRARFDTVIPQRAYDSLIGALNGPTVLTVKTGHFGGFVAERQVLNAVGEFFQNRFYGSTQFPLSRTLSAPTIRFGTLWDGQNHLQVAAGVDLVTGRRGAPSLSVLVSPRGISAAATWNISNGLQLGGIMTARRPTIGLFWSVVL